MENSVTDDFNEPVNKPSGGKIALTHGIYLGFILIVVSLIFYLLDLTRENWVQWVNYGVMLILAIFFIIQFRDKYRGGSLSYGGAFGHGFLLILFAGIISAIYTYVFFAFIAPGELLLIMEEAEQSLYDQGLSDQEIEMALSWTKMMMTPAAMAIWVVIGSAIAGLIISAILGIFLKKEPKAF